MFLRNRNSAIPQSQFFRSPQLQVRNLRTLLPKFSAYIWLWSSLKLSIFLPPGFFCYREDFKGTVAQDFRPLFFFVSTQMNPSHTLKEVQIRFQISITQI
jgi:hypothetical protein